MLASTCVTIANQYQAFYIISTDLGTGGNRVAYYFPGVNYSQAVSIELSVEAFQQLLLQKIIPTQNGSWVELVLSALVLMIATAPLPMPNGLDILADSVTKVSHGWEEALSATCSQACLIVR